MRTPKEIKETMDKNGATSNKWNYQLLMLEIMCNMAISLDRIAKEMKNEE